MVQDPVCGTWVPASQALSIRQGKETIHFCSPDCRDKFLQASTDRKR
jgi:YHS domain-containing protein